MPDAAVERAAATAEERDLAVRRLRPELPNVFVPKVRAEWDAFLALFPHVVGVPVAAPVAGRLLLETRPLPIHVLGMVSEPAWADGMWCSPAEYFFHDLDHARYKIREDLLALGIPCPDATAAGDYILGHVRAVIPAAAERLWELAPRRLRLIRRILDAIDREARRDRDLADAAELLLAEIVHEKSFPMDARVIHRELGHDRHLRKIERKHDAGFYGQDAPPREVVERLDPACRWLRDVVERSA